MTGLYKEGSLLKLKLLLKTTMVWGTALLTLYERHYSCLLIFQIQRCLALASDDL